jgi:hypothetical protein
VARAPADGYTLLHGNINNALNDLLTSDACCRLNEALVPVTRMSAGCRSRGLERLVRAAGTPEPIIRRLHQETTCALSAPDIKEDAASFGSEIGGERPEEFAAFVRAEIAKWGKVITDAGIRLE